MSTSGRTKRPPADSCRKALFRGLGPSLMRAAPAAASTFVAYELTKGTSDRQLLCGHIQLTSQNTSQSTSSSKQSNRSIPTSRSRHPSCYPYPLIDMHTVPPLNDRCPRLARAKFTARLLGSSANWTKPWLSYRTPRTVARPQQESRTFCGSPRLQ